MCNAGYSLSGMYKYDIDSNKQQFSHIQDSITKAVVSVIGKILINTGNASIKYLVQSASLCTVSMVLGTSMHN